MPPLPPLHPTLLVATWRLAMKAQAAKGENILEVWERLRTSPWPKATYDPAQVQKSVLFICSVIGRLGLLNSCLVRALVTGRLLLGHADVMLKIGIHTQGQDGISAPSGHAWVEYCGTNLSDPPEQQLREDLQITHSINLSAETS